MTIATRVSIIAALALGLSGCDKPIHQKANGALRVALSRDCMANLPAGPTSTHYTDWDEVVAQCDENAWYQANQCVGKEAECFAQLQAKEPKP